MTQFRYKSKEVPISEIPVGEVVWVADAAAVGGIDGTLADPPIVGVVVGSYTYQGGLPNRKLTTMTISQYSKGRQTLLQIRGKFNPSLGKYEGIPADSLSVRVLTGSKREVVLRECYDFLMSPEGRQWPTSQIQATGTDPELFALRGDGQCLPAFQFLPAKDSSDVTSVRATYGNSHSVAYWDGWQAEIGVAAGHCHEALCDRIRAGMQKVLRAAQQIDPAATLTTRPVINVPLEDLLSAAPEHVAFGCLPSLNAYGAEGIEVGDPKFLPHRFAGAHIHLGYDLKKGVASAHQQAVQIVKAIDAIAGVASVGLFASLDNPFRRKFYGLAGEYRLPAHGIEYRTLSPAWLSHPALAHLTLDLVRYAASWGPLLRFTEFAGQDTQVQQIINNCDVDAAREWVRSHEKFYCQYFSVKYGHSDGPTRLLNAIYKGAENLVGTEILNGGISSRWRLDSDSWNNLCHNPMAQVRYILEAPATEARGAGA